jgi:hypothetical protein
MMYEYLDKATIYRMGFEPNKIGEGIVYHR